MIQNIHKIIVKLIPAKIPDPKNAAADKVVLAFNHWIQNSAITAHKLIDVANYSQVLDGPGIVLVGLEGNFSLENPSTGRKFAYQRKSATLGDFSARVKGCLETARKAAALLEKELPIRFEKDRFEVLLADRLNVPDGEKASEEFAKAIEEIFKSENGEVEVLKTGEGLPGVAVKIKSTENEGFEI